MDEALVKRNHTGPKPKSHCIHSHELTEENTRQGYSKDGTKNGRRCKQCDKLHNERYRKAHPGVMYRTRTESHMSKRYGISSLDEREAILTAQGGKCATCGRTDCTWRKGFNDCWHIDHVHDGTINYRGILCGTCNLILGKVKDNVELLKNMISYIEAYRNKEANA